ncbi:MAG: hypothetical protein M3164_02120 [Actinomycetota bacterium]|nr:hypothetical protein [Actinomycetota bacterium]
MAAQGSQAGGTNEEVPEGGIFAAPVKSEEGQEVTPSAASSPEELEQKAQEKLQEAQQAMNEEVAGPDLPGVGVQEEETARVAESLVFPGTGIRELKEAAGTDDIEEAVEKLGVQTAASSATENSDRFPPSEWPPKEEQES